MSRSSVAVAWAVVACGVALAGCVDRRMVIRSQPEGARVILDLEEIEGRTPLEVPFEWSGTREVILVAPGYKILEGHAHLEDHWHSYFPLDLFAEVLYPGTIDDVQEFDFELEPYYPEDEPFTGDQEAELERRLAELRERADAHRAGGSQGPGGSLASAPVSRPEKARVEPTKRADPRETDEDEDDIVAPTKPGAPLPPPRAPRRLGHPAPVEEPPPPPPPRMGD